MKLFILLLTLAAFIQTAFLPINLCLVLLIARSLVTVERTNLYAAFISGIILGLLSGANLGFRPLIFLIIVEIAQIFKKLPISTTLFLIPLSFGLIFIANLLESLLFGQHINVQSMVLEMIVLPLAYLLIRFWEERFVVKPGIKLRFKN